VRYPSEVADLLQALLDGIRQEILENLVGVYLRGSLAVGGFTPETSDLDLLVVTERPLCDAELRRLAAMHARIAQLPNPYAQRIEIAYIDRERVKQFRPGQRHPTLHRGPGERLQRWEHRENWILERWSVREGGVALFGPHPQELIAPVHPAQIRDAVRQRLLDWVEWAEDESHPDWGLPRSHKAYVVETMCRALYALRKGEVGTKQEAVEWAKSHLPEPWRDLVVRSQLWRAHGQVDSKLNEEIRRFILWVASQEEGGE
jgi:predicted nucleotidyltransferase